MIAEDEAIVRIGLQTIIDWNRHGFELAGAFSNGKQAWEAIRQNPPDILLTDIRMPEMDGLELIRRIREANLDVNIVILSGYDDFEYTRKAIQLKVQDYLIKHKLDPAEIVETLNALPPRSPRPAEAAAGESVEAEKERLLRMTRGEAAQEEEAAGGEAFPLLELKLRGAGLRPGLLWIALRAKPGSKPHLASERKAAAMLLADIAKRFEQCVFLGEDNGMFHILAIYPEDAAAEAERHARRWAEEELAPPLHDKLNMEFAAGIGRWCAGIGELAGSRRGAEQALRLTFYGGTVRTAAEGGARGLTQAEWLEAMKTIRAHLANEDFEGAVRWIRGQGTRLGSGVDPADAVRLCRMAVHQCADLVMERYQIDLLAAEGPLAADKHPLAKLDAAASWSELAELTAAFLGAAGGTVAAMRGRNDWLGKAIAYIDAHCGNPFRQEDVARHVGLSVNYFSSRFHRETGVSFSDFVARRRINKAIELVRGNIGLSTEEIAERVGFSNPNYFIRLFKKVTGSTWSEFKRKIVNPPENREHPNHTGS